MNYKDIGTRHFSRDNFFHLCSNIPSLPVVELWGKTSKFGGNLCTGGYRRSERRTGLRRISCWGRNMHWRCRIQVCSFPFFSNKQKIGDKSLLWGAVFYSLPHNKLIRKLTSWLGIFLHKKMHTWGTMSIPGIWTMGPWQHSNVLTGCYIHYL